MTEPFAVQFPPAHKGGAVEALKCLDAVGEWLESKHPDEERALALLSTVRNFVVAAGNNLPEKPTRSS